MTTARGVDTFADKILKLSTHDTARIEYHEVYEQPVWRHYTARLLYALDGAVLDRVLRKIDPVFEWLHGRRCANNCSSGTQFATGEYAAGGPGVEIKMCARLDLALFHFQSKNRRVVASTAERTTS